MLKVSQLHKSYGARPVLRGLHLEAKAGSFCVLIGRSGCGKSTLLRILSGLEKPDSGSCALRGDVGMVFQDLHLFPHMTLERNVMAAPRVVKGLSEAEARKLARALLAKVGLQDQLQYFPSQLSGGQQQRAAIARALAMRPKILLYDEPTSSLDPHLSKEVLDVMLELKREGMTQILVTHEHGFAKKAADIAFFIEDGVVAESGPVRRIFGAAKDKRTRRFVAGLK